jgi:hypothetical protein
MTWQALCAALTLSRSPMNVARRSAFGAVARPFTSSREK